MLGVCAGQLWWPPGHSCCHLHRCSKEWACSERTVSRAGEGQAAVLASPTGLSRGRGLGERPLDRPAGQRERQVPSGQLP